jgi:hypothetical protein
LGVNNFDEPILALAECARVARSGRGARLALTTNLRGHMREFYNVYREVLNDLGEARYVERLNDQEHHRVSKESLAEMVEQAGFKISRVVEDEFEMRYLDGSALLRHWLTLVGFLEGWKSVIDKDDQPRVFAGLERKLNELARRNGELRMSVPMLYLEAIRL